MKRLGKKIEERNLWKALVEWFPDPNKIRLNLGTALVFLTLMALGSWWIVPMLEGRNILVQWAVAGLLTVVVLKITELFSRRS